MCIAVILAAVSSLYSRPQLAYIDFDVLAILLSLMLVVAELKEIRFLDWLAVELLNKCRSKRQLELVLLAVTYISSMFVTNDVALLTFVPLALVIGKTLKMDMERIIILQTLAANLGSKYDMKPNHRSNIKFIRRTQNVTKNVGAQLKKMMLKPRGI